METMNHIHSLVMAKDCGECLQILLKGRDEALDAAIVALEEAYVALGVNHQLYNGPTMTAIHPIAKARANIRGVISRINKLRGVEN